MAIEIVNFPINSMVIFNSYVSLPEGTSEMPSRLARFGSFGQMACFMLWLLVSLLSRRGTCDFRAAKALTTFLGEMARFFAADLAVGCRGFGVQMWPGNRSKAALLRHRCASVFLLVSSPVLQSPDEHPEGQ